MFSGIRFRLTAVIGIELAYAYFLDTVITFSSRKEVHNL